MSQLPALLRLRAPKASKKSGLAFLATLAVLVCLTPAQVRAADEEKQAKEIVELKTFTDQITKNMNANELLQFRAIEQTYRTIRAVEDVDGAIASAVKSCGREHPDLKSQLNDDLMSWRAQLRPTMKDARSKLDQMVLYQSYDSPGNVRSYLKLFDRAAVAGAENIKPVPITQREECLKLEKSMNESEPKLKALLIDTLGLKKKDTPTQTK
ncbi:MAG: hypothetical protein JNK24_05160 [Alphaproteobacteria bacterium]|nr:hypothetical protein [Alphaproteobacteria bacterium]